MYLTLLDGQIHTFQDLIPVYTGMQIADYELRHENLAPFTWSMTDGDRCDCLRARISSSFFTLLQSACSNRLTSFALFFSNRAIIAVRGHNVNILHNYHIY